MQRYFAERRSRVINYFQERYPEGIVVVISAHYEQARTRSYEDSMFYYLTGMHHPGAVLVMAVSPQKSELLLYRPTYTTDRSLWVMSQDVSEEALCLDDIEQCDLGIPCKGYSATPYFTEDIHKNLFAYFKARIAGGSVMGFCLASKGDCVQRRNYERWVAHMPDLASRAVDVIPHFAQLRRQKDAHEISHIKQAIAITHQALKEAQPYIVPGGSEAAVYAALLAGMVRLGAREAFPSIVGAGVNSTILHYERNRGVLSAGDGLLIDCGALWNGYAADISRTFAISGRFTERQQMIYDCVRDVQHEVRARARPGMWLFNPHEPEYSLHHTAVRCFAQQGMEPYFLHTIGHFLGLDVHDIGNVDEPLRPGDVITIEPGLYLRDEAFGVRIEDDFLITESGNECLSDSDRLLL